MEQIKIEFTQDEIATMKIGLATMMDDIDQALKEAKVQGKSFNDAVLNDMRKMYSYAQTASDKLHVVGMHSIQRGMTASDDEINDLFKK